MRLSQHIDKGNDDGLFISSVSSCSNLWALIMDAGTGFLAQVYELSPYFLHKVSCFPFELRMDVLEYLELWRLFFLAWCASSICPLFHCIYF